MHGSYVSMFPDLSSSCEAFLKLVLWADCGRSSLRSDGQHRAHIKQSSQQRFPDSHALPRFKLVAPLPFYSNADTLLDILVDSELLIQVI